MSQEILVVDDEVGIRELLSEILTDEGYRVRLAPNALQARESRRMARPDLVLLDIWMPEMDGVTLLKEWAATGMLTMPVVMMSGHGTIETAVEATRIGAFDFLEKPIALPRLLATVERALAKGLSDFRPGLNLAHLGKSPAMMELRKRLDLVVNRPVPVLFVGESGCGAEIAARYLHRHNTPWVAPADNAWLVDNPYALLADSQDGVLFISELAGLDRGAQRGLTQLLGKLERHNVRLICASTRTPAQLVGDDSYDPEILARLSQVVMPIPALRDHAEDIPEIATVILQQMIEGKEVPLRVWSVAALNALRALNWPGNLPALANAVRTLALTSLDGELGVADVQRIAPQFTRPAQAAKVVMEFDRPLREARDQFEQAYFEYHIRRESGNMSRVAERVGLERTHLYRKLKQLGIRPSGRDEPGER
ncbi:MAG: sigma-54-dependent Fis family transcriptional regulator [Pseudomonadota bacterium]|nr:sigma-54-dependent Fis family transcriptional regulator [Pseudomonadota bacterium]